MGDLSYFSLIDMPDMFGLSSLFILYYAYFLYSSHYYSFFLYFWVRFFFSLGSLIFLVIISPIQKFISHFFPLASIKKMVMQFYLLYIDIDLRITAIIIFILQMMK